MTNRRLSPTPQNALNGGAAECPQWVDGGRYGWKADTHAPAPAQPCPSDPMPRSFDPVETVQKNRRLQILDCQTKFGQAAGRLDAPADNRNVEGFSLA